VTFLSDLRADLPQLKTPTLILQCTDDIIAPLEVGNYMQRVMPRAKLTLVDNVGHCPHMSAPSACSEAMVAFLAEMKLP
jgi:sigma-B regulation protein RsbQ